ARAARRWRLHGTATLGGAVNAGCDHIDQVRYLEPAGEGVGCPQCIAAGDTWVHLRMCQICGQIGCCDNSPNRHATAHHEESGHPIIRSVERREGWAWCYEG